MTHVPDEEYEPRDDGSIPAEDDALLRQPTDEGPDDPDVTDDPDGDEREPAHEG